MFRVQVITNTNGGGDWHTCFVVNDVDLPTGYYFGLSAATGELAGVCVCVCVGEGRGNSMLFFKNCISLLPTDNHDIISVKVFDVDNSQDLPEMEVSPYHF